MATFKEALQYAQQNPTSDFAKTFEAGIKSGQFNETAKKEGIDLTPYVQPSQGTAVRVIQSQPEEPTEGTRGLGGVVVGVAQGIGTTIKGLGELGGKLSSPIEKGINKLTGFTPEKQAAIAEAYGLPKGGDIFTPGSEQNQVATDLTTAKTGAEKFGKTVEQIGEFFIPASKVAKAESVLAESAARVATSKAAPIVGEKVASKIGSVADLATRSGVRAAEGAGIVAAQTGGDLDQTKDAAIISAIFPVAGKTASEIGSFIKSKGKDFAPKLINSLIKPSKADFAYGKNPGKAVAEAGIVGSSLDEIATNIGQAKSGVGEQIGQVVKIATDEGRLVSTEGILTPIDDQIAALSRTPKTNATAINRLESLRDDLASIVEKPTINPNEAFDFKQMVGNIATFTGNASDDKAINTAAQDVYRNLKNRINQSAKGIKVGGKTIEDLNESYGGLLSAEKAAVNRAAIAERNNLVSITGTGAGLGGALVGAILSGGSAIPSALLGAGGIGIEKILASPKVKTEVAAWLSKSSPQEKAKVFKAIPALRGAIIKAFIGD